RDVVPLPSPRLEALGHPLGFIALTDLVNVGERFAVRSEMLVQVGLAALRKLPSGFGFETVVEVEELALVPFYRLAPHHGRHYVLPGVLLGEWAELARQFLTDEAGDRLAVPVGRELEGHAGRVRGAGRRGLGGQRERARGFGGQGLSNRPAHRLCDGGREGIANLAVGMCLPTGERPATWEPLKHGRHGDRKPGPPGEPRGRRHVSDP